MDELQKSFMEKPHEPLAFLSGEFTDAEVGSTTFEKEGSAIMQTFS